MHHRVFDRRTGLRAAVFALALLHGVCRSWAQREAQPVALVADAHVHLTSPLDFEVFQRGTNEQGTISISGLSELPLDRVEARISGQSLAGPVSASWHKLELDHATGEFHIRLNVAAGGFYKIEVRVRHSSRDVETATVPHVGVGEVFVISGQSNSTNYGEVPQVTETGMVATFNGESWRLANDPQPGVQDNSKKGSFIPSFGDALYRKYRVPIGIASVGHGSTSVRQWLPAGEPVEVMPTMTSYVIQSADGTLVSDGILFNGMMQRIEGLGPNGFRAVLWHQGESDSHQKPEHEISGETYRRMLEHVIVASRKRAGWEIPWFVANASYGNPATPSSAPIREAQQSLWRTGVALQGPDTDTLGPAYRQNGGKGVHFSDAGLKAHGLLWARQVELYLDPLLH
jgi:hypothetical protein